MSVDEKKQTNYFLSKIFMVFNELKGIFQWMEQQWNI
jgi:hypothetical protein